MIDKVPEVRSSHRLDDKGRQLHEEEDDTEQFLYDLKNKNIITIDDSQEISQTLDQLLGESNNIQFSTLISLAELSKAFPINFLKCLTPNHFNILYSLLRNDDCLHFILLIFSNLSKNYEFQPPLEIFTILSGILSNTDSDDTEKKYSLIISKNLIKLNEVYYKAALHSNILQIILQINITTTKIAKRIISALSSFLKHENHEIEKLILCYIIQDIFIQSNKNEIYREIINAFEYAMNWSELAIQIINNSNLVSISEKLLLSEKNKDVNNALSFLKKCIITLDVSNIHFIKSFTILMAKEIEEYVYGDIITSFIFIILKRSSFRNFLFSSICEIGLNALLFSKSYPIKKLFFSFLCESSKTCPKDIMILSYNDISIFLQEMIQTGESDLQFYSLCFIHELINSSSDFGNKYGIWVKNFSNSLISLNILEDLYQSSLIEKDYDAAHMLDVVSSFLSKYDEE